MNTGIPVNHAISLNNKCVPVIYRYKSEYASIMRHTDLVICDDSCNIFIREKSKYLQESLHIGIWQI